MLQSTAETTPLITYHREKPQFGISQKMAKDDNCFPENCRVDPEFSVLLVAPCNTIPWLNGKPVVTQDLLDMMYRLQICGTLDYTPNLTESDTTKIGGCGAKDCFQKLESYEWTGPVQYCPGNCIIEALVHPTTPCTFDYIYLMYPEDCHNPSIDDIMWVGTAQTRPSGFSFDPRTDTGLRPDLAFKGCSRPMCILNDCCDRGLEWGDDGDGGDDPDPTGDLLDEVQQQLDMGAQDAIAEKTDNPLPVIDEPEALAA